MVFRIFVSNMRQFFVLDYWYLKGDIKILCFTLLWSHGLFIFFEIDEWLVWKTTIKITFSDVYEYQEL